LGGKGYKPRKDYAGRTVSGDWEDSDRGAGNKATRRAGGKVKKKSPTYQAYVLNKEHHQKDADGKVIEHGDGTPSSVEEAKVEAGRSDYGKASVRNKRKFGKEGEPAIFDASGERGKMIDQRRAEHKAKRGVKEDYYRGTGEKVVARTKKFMDKKGQKGAPGLDAMKARAAEHKAKRGVKEEIVTELNRYGKETGKATGSINKRAGTPVKKGGNTRDKALLAVRGMIRRETGKPEGQRKKTKGEKGRVQYGDRRTTPADSIAKRRQSRADAEKLMRDTSGT
jgi:hypothetical protein